MLIKMTDGGIVNYEDNCYNYEGCPTCNYGSEYINEIDITLVHHAIHVKTNQMYEYAISEGQMVRLFLAEYDTIRAMTEKKFIDWFKARLIDIAYEKPLRSLKLRRQSEMELYAVYTMNENGSLSWIDSYWLNYENAVARFKEVWLYEREPTKSELKYHVRKITTQD